MIWYSVLDYGGEERHSIDDDSHDRFTAQACADDYHSNHDGWESHWPLTFVLYESEDGPEVARFHVERDYDPIFYAALITPELHQEDVGPLGLEPRTKGL
jgi:hypothetical protein